MLTSNRLVFLRSWTSNDVTSRTAVYGPVRTVVWQGSVGDHRPYADLTAHVVRSEVLRQIKAAGERWNAEEWKAKAKIPAAHSSWKSLRHSHLRNASDHACRKE